jgi:DNA-binding transcriptional ArsR family regulator
MKKRLEQMRGQAAIAEAMLKALANRHRLLILCQLIDGEHSVGELAGLLGVRGSNVSQHLALLRKDGVVSTRREGQTIWYALASAPVQRLVATLYDIYCGPDSVCAVPPKPTRTKGTSHGAATKSRTR